MTTSLSLQDQRKINAARHALSFVDAGQVVGIGSGSTVARFIELLGAAPAKPPAVVVASAQSEAIALKAGLKIVPLNDVRRIDCYFDGADEIDPSLAMIKGGGAALTREKIIASASKRFICMVDGSKWVSTLGAFPLPVEVVPFAEAYVCDRIAALGGAAKRRGELITDNGNIIIDVVGLNFSDCDGLEATLNNIAGVVCNGLFAARRADVCIIAGDQIETRTAA